MKEGTTPTGHTNKSERDHPGTHTPSRTLRLPGEGADPRAPAGAGWRGSADMSRRGKIWPLGAFFQKADYMQYEDVRIDCLWKDPQELQYQCPWGAEMEALLWVHSGSLHLITCTY